MVKEKATTKSDTPGNTIQPLLGKKAIKTPRRQTAANTVTTAVFLSFLPDHAR